MEAPLIKKAWKKDTKTLAIVYPNLYYGGVYCLAPLIIYNQVNNISNWICERQFLDKHEDLSKFNLVGFTFQYELDLYNIQDLIKKYKPKITFAGGPCVNQNPESLKGIDFFILGEAEEILQKVLEKYTENKEEFLKSIANFQGVYVPKYSKKITYTTADLEKAPYPLYQPLPQKLTKQFVFGASFMLEIERGCPGLCKFCSLGHMHKKPRYRSLESLKRIIDKGIKLNKRNKIVIYSPSFTHPDKKEILRYIISKGLRFSVPSIKVEHIDKETLEIIKQGGQKTLTIAPEANEKIRRSIGKFVTDEQFINFVKLAKQLDFKAIKAYFMIGLPNQEEADLKETIRFINKLKSELKNIHISINAFVPKLGTPFEKYAFNKKQIKQQANYLKKNLKNIKYKLSNIESSYKEYKLANN